VELTCDAESMRRRMRSLVEAQILNILLKMLGLENSLIRAKIVIHFLYVISILCETKTILKHVFLQMKSFVYGQI
jgi:hypothetical protein